jgi:hypothetical protein
VLKFKKNSVAKGLSIVVEVFPLPFFLILFLQGCLLQGDTKKRELLKCLVAAMYSWQHCGTGTLSYRQPRHLVIMDQWNGQQRAFAKKMFYKTMIVW